MFKIMGKYLKGAWEVVDEFDTRAEADKMLTEYQLAYGTGWLLKVTH